MNENDFIKKKDLIINLLSDITEIKKLYSMMEYLSESIITTDSKILSDINFVDNYLSKFESLKIFLSKYHENKYIFTC